MCVCVYVCVCVVYVLSYGQYMSRLKPFWLSSVSCSGIDGSLEECDRSLLIGYSADCSLSSPTVSAFDSAEVNCGESYVAICVCA